MSTNNKLAIDGGPQVRTDPWPARQLFGEEEKQAAIDLFDQAIEAGSAFGYNGEQEENYCKEFSSFLGGGCADAVNSGTNAVYIALKALDLEPFTEVIVPPITDPGGIMPVALLNCIPVPADAAPDSYNMGPDQIEERITERTSAIVVAHISGLPCDMDPIIKLARAHGLPVIEDCAQSHGATYHGQCVGTIGHISSFSMMFGKHHASGGQGGMVFTRNEDLYWPIRRASDRGKPFGLEDAGSNVVASLNCNMDELHAAIGRVQLRKLPGILARLRQAAKGIADGCRQAELKSVRLVEGLPDTEGAYWFAFCKLDTSKLTVDKQTFIAALAAEGMPVGSGYLHTAAQSRWYQDRKVFGTSGFPWTCPLYKGDPDKIYEVPNAVATDASHFTIRPNENWTEKDVADVVAALTKVEAAYAR